MRFKNIHSPNLMRVWVIVFEIIFFEPPQSEIKNKSKLQLMKKINSIDN